MDSHGFLNMLDARLAAAFAALAAGGDLAPAERYRLEGLLEAAVALGLLTLAEAREWVGRHCRDSLGSVPVWPEAPVPVRLPQQQATAPVQPSTRD